MHEGSSKDRTGRTTSFSGQPLDRSSTLCSSRAVSARPVERFPRGSSGAYFSASFYLNSLFLSFRPSLVERAPLEAILESFFRAILPTLFPHTKHYNSHFGSSIQAPTLSLARGRRHLAKPRNFLVCLFYYLIYFRLLVLWMIFSIVA